jgi:hypothetical protein
MSDISDIMNEEFSPEDEYLPGSIFAKEQALAIIGAPGIGKSLVLLQMAVCFLTGRPFLGWLIKKHEFPWLIFQTENNRRRLQGALKAYKKWLSLEEWKVINERLLMPKIVEGFNNFFYLSDEENKRILRQMITPAQPGVIVFDPLTRFEAGNLATTGGMNATFQAFAELANCGREGCSLLILHHSLTGMEGVKRASGFNRGAFGRDSKALVGWVRGQINIVPQGEEDNSKLVVICGKNNNGPEFAPFGIKLNLATMLYEVDVTFDYQAWKDTIKGERVEHQKLTPKNIALLVADIPLTKGDLVKAIKEEYGFEKSKAYQAILAAEGVSIKRDEHGLYIPI